MGQLVDANDMRYENLWPSFYGVDWISSLVRLVSTSFTEYVFFALTAQDFCSDSSFECR